MRLLKILGSLVAGLALAFLAVAAKAQSRYDPDQAWVRKTIKKQHRDEWKRDRQALVIEYPEARSTHRHYRKPRRHYDAPPRHRHDTRDSTRVYGIVMRRDQFSQRDATGHVVCFPPIQGISNERTRQDDAWGDAQRDWSNTVRWTYGERFIDIRNANPIQKQCSISTVKESVAGKIAQGIKEVVGGDDIGNMWRCVVRAGPCQAPIETDPSIKGEPR